jgi:predicted amidophosphoribosyltransferase
MVRIKAQRLPGPWRQGFSLDLHTTSSAFVGYDEFGHEKFDTKYTDLGERLNRLKYKNDDSVLDSIVATAVGFVRKRRWDVQFLVPAPPSKSRNRQPVIMIANAMAASLSIPCVVALRKHGSAPELKNVVDYTQRIKLLEGALKLSAASTKLKHSRVLLLDDLWRSGATLNAAAGLLKDKAGVADVFALTITKTRSNR